jgi:hypothetical protein
MARYVISFQRTVSQVTKHEIEAESMDAALAQADDLVDEANFAEAKFNWVDDPDDCESGHYVEYDRVDLVNQDEED